MPKFKTYIKEKAKNKEWKSKELIRNNRDYVWTPEPYDFNLSKEELDFIQKGNKNELSSLKEIRRISNKDLKRMTTKDIQKNFDQYISLSFIREHLSLKNLLDNIQNKENGVETLYLNITQADIMCSIAEMETDIIDGQKREDLSGEDLIRYDVGKPLLLRMINYIKNNDEKELNNRLYMKIMQEAFKKNCDIIHNYNLESPYNQDDTEYLARIKTEVLLEKEDTEKFVDGLSFYIDFRKTFIYPFNSEEGLKRELYQIHVMEELKTQIKNQLSIQDGTNNKIKVKLNYLQHYTMVDYMEIFVLISTAFDDFYKEIEIDEEIEIDDINFVVCDEFCFPIPICVISYYLKQLKTFFLDDMMKWSREDDNGNYVDRMTKLLDFRKEWGFFLQWFIEFKMEKTA